MFYVEAPSRVDLPNKPKLFMAGGITNCRNWQKELAELIKNTNFIVFNPRRENYNSSLEREQITWEHDMLNYSHVISFWFTNQTLQPITLLELGVRLGQFHYSKDEKPFILIGIEPGYLRKNDVEIQYELATGTKPIISSSIQNLAERIVVLDNEINKGISNANHIY